MGALIGLAILVLDIIAILDCLKSNRNTTEKAVWIIVVLVLPFLGMILYFLMGKKK